MKKIFLFLFAVVSTFLTAEKRLGVATFDVVGNAVSGDEAQIITELYVTELARIGWVVIPSSASKFNKALGELKFQANDWSDASKTAKLGSAMNVDVISTGKIMKLGAKLYIIATLIEAKTAEVLSSSRMEAKNVGDIPDVLAELVEGLAKNNTPRVISGKYKTGDTGPGGGIVFYHFGHRMIEVSEILGIANSQPEAIEMCERYRGGGYGDWYLPMPDELDLVYEYCIILGGIIQDRHTYWTSKREPESCCEIVKDFSDGEIHSTCSYEIDERMFAVRAVRVFYVSEKW